jgi:hypothetical protein
LLRGRDQKRITKGTREFLKLSKAECEVTATKRFDDGCRSATLLIIPRVKIHRSEALSLTRRECRYALGVSRIVFIQKQDQPNP